MQASGIIRLCAAFGLSLGFFTWAPGGIAALAQASDPQGIELLSQALKAYESGDYSTAAASIDQAFQAGLSKEHSARAILLRAQINERSGALARALQDYSNALWMDTLPPPDRKRASDGKQRVIAAMGLSAPAPVPSRPGGVSQAAAPGGGSGIPPAAPESSSGGVFGVFDGLFGAPDASPPQAAPAREPTPGWQTATASSPTAAAPSAPPVAASATPVLTRAKEAASEQAKAPAPRNFSRAEPPVQTPVRMASIQPVSVTSGSLANGFTIVFGSASSEAAGQTKARQIKAALADILVSRNLDVEASAGGGFQIVAGPYKAKAAALALCSAIKQRGVACQVTP